MHNKTYGGDVRNFQRKFQRSSNVEIALRFLTLRRTIYKVITYFQTTVLPPEQLNYNVNLATAVNP